MPRVFFLEGDGGHERRQSGTVQCNVGENCHWLIQVSQGQKVRITFETFTLNEKSDRAEIYDGKDEWTPFVTFTKDLQPQSITSNGHFVRIISNGFVKIHFEETSTYKIYDLMKKKEEVISKIVKGAFIYWLQ